MKFLEDTYKTGFILSGLNFFARSGPTWKFHEFLWIQAREDFGTLAWQLRQNSIHLCTWLDWWCVENIITYKPVFDKNLQFVMAYAANHDIVEWKSIATKLVLDRWDKTSMWWWLCSSVNYQSVHILWFWKPLPVCYEAYKTTVSRNANMAKLQAGYLFPEVCAV